MNDIVIWITMKYIIIFLAIMVITGLAVELYNRYAEDE